MDVSAANLSPAAQLWLQHNTVRRADGGVEVSNLERAKRDLAENWNIQNSDRLELVSMLPTEQRQALLASLPGWMRSQVTGNSAVNVHELRAHQTGPIYDVDFSAVGAKHTGLKAHALAVLAKRDYEDLGLPGTTVHPGDAAAPLAFKELLEQGWSATTLGSVSSKGLDTSDSTQAYAAIKGNKVIFAARGTEPDRLQDVLIDAKLLRVPTTHGEMHAGFQEAADQVWPALKKLLEEQGPGVHLDLTGHSLGAAIAEEIAMRVHDQLGDKVVIDGVYPFEPPNMYDRKAAEAYDRALGDRTFGYVVHRDIVTQIPPIAAGYHPVGRRMYVDGDAALRPEATAGEIAKDRLLRPLEALTASIVNGEATEIYNHGSFVKAAFLARNEPVDFTKANLAHLQASLGKTPLFTAPVSPHSVLLRLNPAERSRVLFDLPRGAGAARLVKAVAEHNPDDLRAWLQAAPQAVAKHAAFQAWLSSQS